MKKNVDGSIARVMEAQMRETEENRQLLLFQQLPIRQLLE